MKRKHIGNILALALPVVLALASCPNTSMTELDAKSTYAVRIYPIPEHGALKLSEEYVTSGNWITVYVNPDPGCERKNDRQR
jgi:hypothetical protein